MHWDNKIHFLYYKRSHPSHKATPLIRPLLHCRMAGLIRGWLHVLYMYIDLHLHYMKIKFKQFSININKTNWGLGLFLCCATFNNISDMVYQSSNDPLCTEYTYSHTSWNHLNPPNCLNEHIFIIHIRLVSFNIYLLSTRFV